MAPQLLPRYERTEEAPSTKGARMNTIYIVGIVLACLILTIALAWWGWKHFVHLRKKKAALNKRASAMIAAKEKPVNGQNQPSNAFSRNKVTPAIVLPKRNDGEVGSAARLPPPRLQVPNGARPMSLRVPSANSSQSSLRKPTGLRNSITPGGANRMSCASMTAQEIVDHHMTSGNYPASFAPLALGDFGSKFSITASDAEASSTDGGTEKANDSVASLPTTPTKKKHGIFPSISTSIRHSFAFPGSGLSPTRAAFQFGSKHSQKDSADVIPGGPDLASMGTDQRTVNLMFSPLLPDELVLKLHEKVVVLETYDDGWCICARVHLGMLEVGAIPEHCFEAQATGAGMDRPMRSSSLGVTVDLRVIEEMESGGGRKKGGVRDSVMSWSNF